MTSTGLCNNSYLLFLVGQKLQQLVLNDWEPFGLKLVLNKSISVESWIQECALKVAVLWRIHVRWQHKIQVSPGSSVRLALNSQFEWISATRRYLLGAWS